MAKTITQKPHLEKHEIEKIARIAINALNTNLLRGTFNVETDGDTVAIEAVDVKAFISRHQIIVLFGFIDIHYSNKRSVVKVYDYEKNDYIYVDMDHLRRELETLLELAKQKVKEKLEKVLEEL